MSTCYGIEGFHVTSYHYQCNFASHTHSHHVGFHFALPSIGMHNTGQCSICTAEFCKYQECKGWSEYSFYCQVTQVVENMSLGTAEYCMESVYFALIVYAAFTRSRALIKHYCLNLSTHCGTVLWKYWDIGMGGVVILFFATKFKPLVLWTTQQKSYSISHYTALWLHGHYPIMM